MQNTDTSSVSSNHSSLKEEVVAVSPLVVQKQAARPQPVIVPKRSLVQKFCAVLSKIFLRTQRQEKTAPVIQIVKPVEPAAPVKEAGAGVASTVTETAKPLSETTYSDILRKLGEQQLVQMDINRVTRH